MSIHFPIQPLLFEDVYAINLKTRTAEPFCFNPLIKILIFCSKFTYTSQYCPIGYLKTIKLRPLTALFYMDGFREPPIYPLGRRNIKPIAIFQIYILI